jgi:alanine dehydrogenase
MIIGVPREIKDHEFRVSLTPEGVRTLCAAGHTVWVEPTAGDGSGFSDEQYHQAGARLAGSKEQLFKEAELIVKVKEPLASEYALFRSGQLLFTYLHLAASVDLTKALMEAQVTAIAYETTESQDGSLPMLKPMSEIAGRLAVQVGAGYLERLQGGSGVLLGGVPGAATEIAVGMGAQVTVINQDLERLRELDALYRGRIVTLASQQSWIDRAVEEADLVIGAVMVRGAKAPKLVSRSVVARMRSGSVIVDVAVDQGGCIETTRPTSHSDPVYRVEGVLHYCVPNMPGIVPRTSTLALTNATLPFIVRLASAGLEPAMRADPGFARGINVAKGKVMCRAVAEAHGMAWTSPA